MRGTSPCNTREADEAGPISHTSTLYIDFVETFCIPQDFSIYLAHFIEC